MKVLFVLLLSIVFSQVQYIDEAFEEVDVGLAASETEILNEELLDDDAAWIREEEEQLALEAEFSVGATYTKLTKKHCARQKMDGNLNAETLHEAKNMCDNESDCGGVYDSDCDNSGRFYLCKLGFAPAGSRASCVYKKESSNPDPQPSPKPVPQPKTDTYKKVEKKHCSKQKLASTQRALTLAAAKTMCDAESDCGGIYDSRCDNKGEFFMCKKGFTPAKSSSSCLYVKGNGGNNPQPTGPPQPKPQTSEAPKPSPLDTCVEKGSCPNSVAKCGHCLYNSQCEGKMYCCPYMKKCVVHGGTPCFTPIAECIPPCRENSPGYPNDCKCGNKKFPNEWYNTKSSGGPSVELAIAQGEDMSEMTTSDELEVAAQAHTVQYVRHEHGSTVSKISQYFIVFLIGVAVAGIYKTICYKLNPPTTDEFESLLVEEI